MNKDWKRIMLTSMFLVGTAGAFGYWSISEFNKALSNVDKNEYPASVINPVNVGASVIDTVSTMASTPISTSTSIDVFVATSTNATSTIVDLDPKTFSLTFPAKGDVLYTGCTYGLKWASSTKASSFDLWLVDDSKLEKLKPSSSGLVGTSSYGFFGILPWTVGDVDQGTYYILVSKIDGVDITYRTDKFSIKKDDNNNASSTDVCAR